MARFASVQSTIFRLPEPPSYESIYQADDIEELYGAEDEEYYRTQSARSLVGLMVGFFVFGCVLILAPGWVFEHLGLISLVVGLIGLFGRGGVFASQYMAGFARNLRLSMGVLALVGGLVMLTQDATNLDFLPDSLQIAQNRV